MTRTRAGDICREHHAQRRAVMILQVIIIPDKSTHPKANGRPQLGFADQAKYAYCRRYKLRNK